MNDEHLLITLCISVWGWHLLGMMFFIAGWMAFFFKNPVMTIVFMAVFVICEIVAYIRKAEIYLYTNKKEDENNGKEKRD